MVDRGKKRSRESLIWLATLCANIHGGSIKSLLNNPQWVTKHEYEPKEFYED